MNRYRLNLMDIDYFSRTLTKNQNNWHRIKFFYPIEILISIFLASPWVIVIYCLIRNCQCDNFKKNLNGQKLKLVVFWSNNSLFSDEF